MANKAIVLSGLFLLLLGSCAVATAVLRPTVDTAVTNLVEEVYEDAPLDDAMEVYTIIRNGKSRGWMPVALLLICLIAIGSILAYLRLSPEFYKRKTSWLREMKKGKSQKRPQPQSWVVQQPPTLQPPDDVSMLPDGSNSNHWSR
ncbi:MAG: hypothetical protein GY805_24255 [Chloroflexi bacterium]|nr:hypothetical protein [Chloroflexota bacterium]